MTADGRRRVVVTGAAGTVGTVLLRLLDRRFEVVGVDRHRPRQQVPGRPVRRGDLRRTRVARRAVDGADTVVHLAAGATLRSTWRIVSDTNVRMTINVLEAAAACGVRRVVLASSNHVVGGYERDEPYRSVIAGARDGLDAGTVPRLATADPARPDSPYAVGKVLDEAAGRYFAEKRGLSVLALRIGTVRPGDGPEAMRHLATLLTHRDLTQLVQRCIDAPDTLRFGTFYGVSANAWRIWDIEDSRALLGYEPVDDAERRRHEVERL